MRSFLPIVLLSLGFTLSANGQTPAAPAPSTADSATTKMTVEAKLVVVPVVVRDKHNALLSTLGRESFSLNVDGIAQTIRYFDHDADVPLTVGLLVDTSMSQREVLPDERTASAAFLEKMLAPDRDKAFVIQFAANVELLQDVTNSRPKLQEALQQLDTTPQRNDANTTPNSSGDSGYGRHGASQHHGGTALYDAAFLSADEVISKQKGRRSLILLTDGVDNGSKESLAKAIEAAQRADTVVYAIYYKGQDHGGGGGDHHGFPGGGGGMGGSGGGGHGGGGGGWPGGGGGHGGPGGGGHQDVDGKKILERLCSETGGSVFEVTKKETIEKIYTEIGEELRAQYRLGFTPSESASSEGYHKITVSLNGELTKQKNQVQTRDGYYTKGAAATH